MDTLTRARIKAGMRHDEDVYWNDAGLDITPLNDEVPRAMGPVE